MTNINTEVARLYAMPRSVKEKLKSSNFKIIYTIADKDPDEIINTAKEVMKYWTPDNMNNCLGTDMYTDADYDDDLLWARRYTDCDNEELETVLQINRLFNQIGVDITLRQSEFIWSYISNQYCASWLCKEDDTDCWYDVLHAFLYNQPAEVKEKLSAGGSN